MNPLLVAQFEISRMPRVCNLYNKTEGESMFRLLSQFSVVSVVLLSFLLIFSPVVSGQTKGDVYLGYSFVSSGLTVGSCCFSGAVSSASAGRASLNGWEASASIRLSPWLRAVGDVSAGYGTVPVVFSSILGSEKVNANTNLHTYLFGPRASVSVGRLTPFGHALFGLAHQSIAASTFITNVGQEDNAFAFALGGGVDLRLVSRVAWRVQADYLQTKVFNSTQHDPRISTGIVLRF
jgi:opacity protein-like surface antigen